MIHLKVRFPHVKFGLAAHASARMGVRTLLVRLYLIYKENIRLNFKISDHS